MVIATDSSSMPTGPPIAVDCWPCISVAVALETSATAVAATAYSIITAADAAAVNAADAAVATPLAAAAGINDDDAITMSKHV